MISQVDNYIAEVERRRQQIVDLEGQTRAQEDVAARARARHTVCLKAQVLPAFSEGALPQQIAGARLCHPTHDTVGPALSSPASPHDSADIYSCKHTDIIQYSIYVIVHSRCILKCLILAAWCIANTLASCRYKLGWGHRCIYASSYVVRFVMTGKPRTTTCA